MDRTLMVRLFRRKALIFSGAIILLMSILVLFAPGLAPHDPNLIDIERKLQAPSLDFPLGTDHLGRCILSRLVYGARVSLGTAFLVMGTTMMISIFIGTYAGYKGGRVDYLFMRFCDVLLAFPSLFLALALIGILGPGLLNLFLAMVLVQWVFYARIIRGMVLSVKEQNYILAAKVSGTSGPMIIIRHIFPAILSQVTVLFFMDIGGIILTISGLSFLGLGIQPPTAEWGAMINDSKQFFRSQPSLMMYPGLMIVTIVMAFNLFGDTLRDALDVRQD